jgi:hypothetical protein
VEIPQDVRGKAVARFSAAPDGTTGLLAKTPRYPADQTKEHTMNAQRHREEAKDLDFRAADGIEVTLLWAKPLNRVWVAVRNHRSGEEFELEVRAADNALDVFRHPYAYAAARMPELLAAA